MRRNRPTMIDLDIRTHFTPSPPLAAHALLRPLRSLATWGPALRMKARCCGDDDRYSINIGTNTGSE